MIKGWLADPALPTVLIVVAIVLIGAQLTKRYVPVWQSEATLWGHAVQQAPKKPRPALNYGVALINEGRLAEARQFFRQALTLAESPTVPAGEAAEIRLAASRNLAALDALERAWR